MGVGGGRPPRPLTRRGRGGPEGTREPGTVTDVYDRPVYLEDALDLKLRLQGVEGADPQSSIVAVNATIHRECPDISAHAGPDGTVTLMFTDIENSTALTEQMGDARWMDLLRAHNALVEGHVKRQRGQVVKTMGDGYMVAFSSPRRALECAIASQRALVAWGPLAGIRVRMGLHTGEVLKEDDFFGRHVNLAARVAGQAGGGEIFVSGRRARTRHWAVLRLSTTSVSAHERLRTARTGVVRSLGVGPPIGTTMGQSCCSRP